MTWSCGPYRIVGFLARGGMGMVYRAVDPGTGMAVAVKVLGPPERGAALRGVPDEVRAAAALHHPHVVQINDHGVVGRAQAMRSGGAAVAGTPWFAMELAEATLADASPPLPFQQVKDVVGAVLAALAHAHGRGVLHRDVKPANVLRVRRAPGIPRWVLADFGIALVASGTRVAGTSGRRAGTRGFQAPEDRLSRPAEPGPEGDIYAVGVLGWWLTFGALPGAAPDGDPVVPDGWADVCERVGAPRSWIGWLLRALQPDPRDRFREAAEARESLERLLPTDGGASPRDPGPGPEWDEPGVTATFDTGESATLGAAAQAPAKAGAGTPPSEFPRPLPAGPVSVPDRWRGGGSPWSAGEARAEPTPSLFAVRAPALAGRIEERDRLWTELVATDRGGSPRAVLLRGPSGSGRTHLARWLSEAAREHGGIRTWHASFGDPPGPSDGLAAMLGRHLPPVADEGCGAGRGPPGWEDVPEDLADALVDHLRRMGSAPATPLARLAGATVRAMARRRTWLVWLDDIDADPEGERFVAELVRPSPEAPARLLVVATVGAGGSSRSTRVAAEREGETVRSIQVCPMPAQDLRLLMWTFPRLAPAVAAALEAHAAGSPLFARELVASWVRTRRLLPTPDGLAPRGRAPLGVPEDLRAHLGSRIDALLARWKSPAGRRAALEALELAAALGTGVRMEDWREVADSPRALSRLRSLRTALLDALLARPEPWGFSFSDGAFRSALEQSARAAGRWREHRRRVARVLARRSGRADLLFHAHLECGEPEEALALLVPAFYAALASESAPVALVLLDAAEAAIDRGAPTAGDACRAMVWALRGQVAVQRGRYSEAEDLCSRAAALARKAGNPQAAARANQFVSPAVFSQGRSGEAIEHLRGAIEDFGAAGDGRGVLSCTGFLVVMLASSGRIDEALSAGRSALERPETAATPEGEGLVHRALADVHAVRRDPEAARAALLSAINSFRRAGSRRHAHTAEAILAMLMRVEGLDGDGAALAGRAARYLDMIGADTAPFALAVQAAYEVDAGRWDEAEATLERGHPPRGGHGDPGLRLKVELLRLRIRIGKARPGEAPPAPDLAALQAPLLAKTPYVARELERAASEAARAGAAALAETLAGLAREQWAVLGRLEPLGVHSPSGSPSGR